MKRERKLYLSLFLVMILGLVLAGCGGESETSTTDHTTVGEKGAGEQENGSQESLQETMKPITLSFADFFPNTHQASIRITQAWADAVEEATDGLVKVEVYPAGTLLGDDDIYEGVISGIAHVGHSAIGYNLGRFPLLNALYLGGIKYTNSKVSSYVARDIVNEFDPEELHHTQLMFVYGLSPGTILSKRPIRALEDLEGMEIRASGTQIDTLEMLGATPVGMGMGDAYEALARGVIQGNLAPAEVLEGWNMAEVIDYITAVPFVYNSVHYVTMNKEVWESFPESIQAAINEVNEKIFEEAASSLWDQLNESAMEYTRENFDVEIIELSEEEHARWLERLEPLHEDYIEKMEANGLPGREVLQRILELTEQYNSQFQ
jgi:TRAP-type C4-dicarboxylate transport system substrate-binding protein